MENLIDAIRTSLREDADLETRRAGLVACREIVRILEATDPDSARAGDASSGNATSQEPVSSSPGASAPSSSSASATAAATGQPAVSGLPLDATSIGAVPPEQLLDLAIARLRAALPPGTSVPAQTPLRFQLVPLHRSERSK